MKISIVGLDKVTLLLNLYNKANNQGKIFDERPMSKRIGSLSAKNTGNIELAEKIIYESQDYCFDHVDLGAGSRPLKISLEGFEIDTSTYDEYHGEGLGELVVQGIFADMFKVGELSDVPVDTGNIELPRHDTPRPDIELVKKQKRSPTPNRI
jgi:hypothetical protein